MLNINSSDTEVCLDVPNFCTSPLTINNYQGYKANTHYLLRYFAVNFENE